MFFPFASYSKKHASCLANNRFIRATMRFDVLIALTYTQIAMTRTRP